MTITVDAPNKKIAVNFTDSEWDALVWARNKHGADVARDLLRNWLKTMWQQKEAERLEGLKATVPPELA